MVLKTLESNRIKIIYFLNIFGVIFFKDVLKVYDFIALNFSGCMKMHKKMHRFLGNFLIFKSTQLFHILINMAQTLSLNLKNYVKRIIEQSTSLLLKKSKSKLLFTSLKML